ncbi:3',5'-cyclic AMP phosphodiesterase CpdA [Desulfuromusa kysingii]|uniref:3',5'-cyclic AMP phosphodiesterase CpdA n=1 Tax=Desulfuromusa kysingii TaxID=37625 RepID=A0A1H3ZZ02_9BACT|nr:metallophosphoesterase [Desulfuromusa kysingii]SEA29109.1 3',5'-cyclic AMP phosphodiesterase CpdA [Desulfuromusa kysingii]
MNMLQQLSRLFLLVSFALGVPVVASAYDAYNITIQLGSNEQELNFTWFTRSEPTGYEELMVYDVSDLSESYAATCTEVDVEEGESLGGPPGTDTTDDTTDDSIDEDDSTVYSCRVTSVSVEESSTYYYILGDGDSYTESVDFQTEDSQDYNFIFVGDPQIGSHDTEEDAEGWSETVTKALTTFPETSFILSAGDQVNTASSDSEYDGFFAATELSSTPFAPALGNHDTNDLYSYHFSVPNESQDYGVTDGGGDYWFTYGDTLFMVINTNSDSNSEHETFVEEAIEANPDVQWKIVVFHHSIFSSASHVDDVNDIRTVMYPIIDDNDIDMVLSGHDHFYARTYQLSGGEIVEGGASYTSTDRRSGEEVTKHVDLVGDVIDIDNKKIIGQTVVVDPEGTVYITANSASGSKYYDFTDIDGYTNYYFAMYEQLETPTYLNVKISGYTVTVSSYRTDTGELLDSYSIVKSREGRHAYE